MVVKVYISGICGSQEVRKQQQRVLFILQGMHIKVQVIDITEPGREEDLAFMQDVAKKHEKSTQRPPQIFNDETYCGDYMDFELANDEDRILRFLKLEDGQDKIVDDGKQNGIYSSEESSRVFGEPMDSEVIETNETHITPKDEEKPEDEAIVLESLDDESKEIDNEKQNFEKKETVETSDVEPSEEEDQE